MRRFTIHQQSCKPQKSVHTSSYLAVGHNQSQHTILNHVISALDPKRQECPAVANWGQATHTAPAAGGAVPLVRSCHRLRTKTPGMRPPNRCWAPLRCMARQAVVLLRMAPLLLPPQMQTPLKAAASRLGCSRPAHVVATVWRRYSCCRGGVGSRCRLC